MLNVLPRVLAASDTKIFSFVVEQITPPSRPIADWDAVVERQSYWTLHEAYHNLVPANASKGTWPLSPVDKQFEYIRALTLAHAWL